MLAQPRLASTVMLLRDSEAGQGIEVFMVRRVVESEFMPGIYVFPGGSVSVDDHLAYFAHWITPEALPRRFDTYFFLAPAPNEQEAIYDRLETSEGIWIRPAEALERLSRNEFPTGFPTFHQLRDLSAYFSVQEAIAATATRYVPSHMPLMKIQDGKAVAYLPEAPEQVWYR